MAIGWIPIKLASLFIGVGLLAMACGGAATDSRLTIEDWDAALARAGIDIENKESEDQIAILIGALRMTGYRTEDERYFAVYEYKDSKAAANPRTILGDADDTFLANLPTAVNGNLRLYYIQGKIEGFNELEALLDALERR